jgi:hypothetical protein
MMTIDYRFGDLDAHGVTIRAQAMALEAEHQAIIGDVLAAGDLWGRADSGVLPTVHRRPGPQFPGGLPAGQRSWRQGADRRRVTFHPFERPDF